MGERSAIEWTDNTFNPWTGCERVSPACQHCYAEAWAKRTGTVEWGKNAERRRTTEAYWRQPLRWNQRAKEQRRRERVFCASLADVFEDRDELDPWRADLFDLIDATPFLDWLLLTKRPENIVMMISQIRDVVPLNVWLGTTVEDQQRADERIPELIAADDYLAGGGSTFLSCEPLLGPVNIERWLPELGWVIAGGESGPGARPMDPEWLVSLRDQCQSRALIFDDAYLDAVPFFFKQWGEHDGTGVRVGKKQAGAVLDGREWREVPW